MSRACRVFIVASHPLFALGVQSLLSGQSGLAVIGMGEATLDVIDKIHDLKPDVVVLDADSDAQTRLLPALLRENMGVKFIGLTLEDNRIDIYYQQQFVGTDVSDLVEAVRAPLIWRGGLGGMRILAVLQGQFGRRIVANILEHGPKDWSVEVWRTPASLPVTIEDPTEYLPPSLPRANLILMLADQPGAVQLLPQMSEMTGAEGVIIAVDNPASLPPGLLTQVCGWLNELGVTAVFPKPLCTLTRKTFNLGPKISSYFSDPIAEFAHYFGRPLFQVNMDSEKGVIKDVKVLRDSCCGCARYVAQHLIGVSRKEAESKACILHHHFPCLASMGIDPDYGDTLLQVSGHILRQTLREQIELSLLGKNSGQALPSAESTDVAVTPTLDQSSSKGEGLAR